MYLILPFFVAFCRPVTLPQPIQTQHCHGDSGHLPLDFLLGGFPSHTLVYWLVSLFKGCLIQLVQFAVLEDTMKITLVIAVCVAVVLLGQARISTSRPQSDSDRYSCLDDITIKNFMSWKKLWDTHLLN